VAKIMAAIAVCTAKRLMMSFMIRPPHYSSISRPARE
jgi:hypothetical protein